MSELLSEHEFHALGVAKSLDKAIIEECKNVRNAERRLDRISQGEQKQAAKDIAVCIVAAGTHQHRSNKAIQTKCANEPWKCMWMG